MNNKAQKEPCIGPPFQVKENAIASEEISKALKNIEERFMAAGLDRRVYQWKPKRIVKEIMEQYTEFKSYPFWKK